MQKILIWGAGCEARGFLADIFLDAHWETTLVDTDAALVRKLRSTGEFHLIGHSANDTWIKTVRGFRADTVDGALCARAAREAQVIAICVFPDDLPEVADALAPLLEDRFIHDPESPLEILMCLNEADLTQYMLSMLCERVCDARAVQALRERVCISDTIVRRTCVKDENDSLAIHTNGFPRLVCQHGQYDSHTGISSIERVRDIAEMKTIKLYSYNLVHCCYAYSGYLKGYHYLAQSREDMRIQHLAERALAESTAALKVRYGLTDDFLKGYIQELWAYAVIAQMPDRIDRVANDPIRKLARHERMTGPALLCHQLGMPCGAIARIMAYALAYNAPEDHAAVKLQMQIAQDGLRTAAARICGIEREGWLLDLVEAEYDDVVERKGV